ncbi:hypothetical protein [Alicyclobacillus sp. SO9]|uniref:hypothetical protein n=1 Tax=Alicyclobacillus sp. SO9 TaxID=2665646 RepID=UPI0018E87AA0|nr:hypothetical protein [Alicyclobacillus sp. SO9]QQE79845.1 hypothetical protein GI364_04995 [Alicyclobacillus sp. SO9]
MLNVIAAHAGMLVMMWIVLIATGVEMLVYLAQNLRQKSDIRSAAKAVTEPLVFSILPLLILSWLTAIDGTGILIRIWYYVAAVLLVIRALIQLTTAIQK